MPLNPDEVRVGVTYDTTAAGVQKKVTHVAGRCVDYDLLLDGEKVGGGICKIDHFCSRVVAASSGTPALASIPQQDIAGD